MLISMANWDKAAGCFVKNRRIVFLWPMRESSKSSLKIN